MRPVRVLHVFGRMNRGGAEVRTLEVMRSIDRSRFHFEFCCTSGLPGELDAQIRDLGGEVYPLPLGPMFPVRFGWLLRSGRFDAVHAHVHYFSGLPLWIAARQQVPVRIVHFRTTSDGRGNSPRRRMQSAFMRTLLERHATAVFGVSEAALRAAWGERWNEDPRCRVVYNGIDLSAFEHPNSRERIREQFGIEPEATLVIHVARFDPAKNHRKLFRVFREISRRDASARLLLVGPGVGEDTAQLDRLLAGSGIESRVLFAGRRPDVPHLFAAADLMIFPSVREGLPGALLEAAAAGVPVLASGIEAVREVASRVPLIEILPLEESDAVWAVKALAILKRGRRVPPLKALEKTPFKLVDTVRAFENAYQEALA